MVALILPDLYASITVLANWIRSCPLRSIDA